MDDKPGQIIRVERLSHAQAQDLQRHRDNLSFDVRKQKSFEKGFITKVYSRRHYDVQVPGRAHPYTRVPTMEPTFLKLGQVVTMAFVGSNTGIPVILVRQQEKRPRLFLGAEEVGLYSWPTYRQADSRKSLLSDEQGVYFRGTPKAGLFSVGARAMDGSDYRNYSGEDGWIFAKDASSLPAAKWLDFSIPTDSIALYWRALEWVYDRDGVEWYADHNSFFYSTDVTSEAIGIFSITGGVVWEYPLPVREVEIPDPDDGGGGDPGGGAS